eukprot:5904521-Alexandrium_andersonii.AAC.1
MDTPEPPRAALNTWCRPLGCSEHRPVLRPAPSRGVTSSSLGTNASLAIAARAYGDWNMLSV